MNTLIGGYNNAENRSSNEQMQKYGEYATLSKLRIDQKKPERFTFGEKFYVNEIR